MSSLDEKPAVESAAASASDQAEQSAAMRLFQAVNDGDLDTVKQLLPAANVTSEAAEAAAAAGASASTAVTVAPASSKPLSVNLADSAGFTPLIAAARLGRESIVDYLLTLPGIDVNARTAHWNTAFLYACGKGNVSIVRTLLESGADFFHTNVNHDSCLALACISGDVPTVQFVIGAYHQIQKAKSAHAQGTQISHRKWFTSKNEEGLTALMCGTMGGCADVVRLILSEVRRELGVTIPTAQLDPASRGEPSAQRDFYPSLDVLGPLPFDSSLAGGYVDPAPPAFLAYVNAQNLMGDTAAHIASQNQSLPLFFLLVDNGGADPMRVNRRGKRAFELFKETGEEKAEEATETPAAASPSVSAGASASSSSSPSSSTPVHDAVTAHLLSLLQFQRGCREEYARVAASHSEKLFAELMDEEEEAQARSATRGAKNKKNSAGGKKKAGGGKKKTAAALAAEPASITLASDSDEPTSPASSPRLAPVAAPSGPSAAASAAPALSPSAPPFVPLSAQSAADAASGWETVAPKAAKHAAAKEKSKPAQAAATTAVAEKKKVSASPVPPVTTAAAAAAPVPHASPAKVKSDGKSKSRKSNATSAAAPPPSAVTHAPASAAASVVAPAAAPAVAAPSAPIPYTLVPVATPDAAAVDPTPSSSFFAGFTSRPRAWRPITALHPRRSPPPTDAATAAGTGVGAGAGAGASSPPAVSSSDDQLASLQSQFSSLHPHIESTDLHVQHLMGAEWSTLSSSQLAVLDDVLSALTRQLRETQAQHAQQQLQELSNEMQRTRSELNVLRKEVIVLKAKQQE